MRQCLDSRISPAPTPPPIPVTETVASREDPIAREIRSARHHRSVWQRNG